MRKANKLLALILALAMCASLTVTPAMAEESLGAPPAEAADTAAPPDAEPDDGSEEETGEEPAQEISFNDIEESWAKDYILQAAKDGLFNGYEDGSFRPENTLTRAEILQVLYNLEGNPTGYESNSFTDGSGQWYSAAVDWAAAEGLLKGYEDGSCGALNQVTREELVTFLYRYAQTLEITSSGGSLDSFPDAGQVSDWALEAFQWAVSAGIINGVPTGQGNELQPQGAANRASFAKMITVFEDYLAKQLTITVVDGSNGTLAANTEQERAFVTLSGAPGVQVTLVELGEESVLEIPESGILTIEAPENTEDTFYCLTLTMSGIEEPVEAGTDLLNPVVVTITEGITDYYVSHGQSTARYLRAAVYADENGVSATKSVLAAADESVTAGDKSASDIVIFSDNDYFGGVRTGGSGEFTLSDSTITLYGDGGDDFTGIGAAVAAADESTLIVKNAEISTYGIIRQALFVGDSATLKVYDSTIECDPGEYQSDVSISTAGMSSPPNGLGVYGNCRALNLVDSGTIYLENCDITSKNWGALGVDDVTDGHLTAVNCSITIQESGYGAYAIGKCVDEFQNCTFDITNGTVAYAAAGDGAEIILSQGTVARSDRYGLVTHQSFNGTNTKLVVKDEGTILSADQAAILVKGRGSDITIKDGAVVESANGPIIRAMLNDDTGAGSMDGTEVVNVSIENTTLTGDIVQAMGAAYESTETGDSDTQASDTSAIPMEGEDVQQPGDGMNLGGDMSGDGPMGPSADGEGGGMGPGGGSSSAKTESVMNVTLTEASLTGIISSAECELTIPDGNISLENIDSVGSVESTTYCFNDYAVLNVSLEDGSTWNITGNSYVYDLEIDESSSVTADYPVIVYFKTSSTVESGDVVGNVQFLSADGYDEVIAIVHTNDVHGHLDVEPYVKGLADELKASGDYSLVLTVSAGDVYGGGEAVAGSYNGEFIPAVMDQVYDVMAPGNNDFGLTGAAKQDLLINSLFEHTVVLCDSYTVKEGGIDMAAYAAEYGDAAIDNELLDSLYNKISLNEDGSLNWDAAGLQSYEAGVNPYTANITYTTEKGTVVGLFGLSTSGGAAETYLDAVSSLTASQEQTDALRAAGADVVIGVGHTGWPDGDETLTATSSNDTNSAQIALNTTGIDAFVDGHTHSIINGGEGWMGGESNTLVNQAASFGSEIGVMTLYLKDGVVVAKDAQVLEDYSDITPDADVQATVDLAMNKVQEDLGKVIAHTDVFLNGERQSAGNEGGTVRGNETNLGDLMTDIIFDATTELGYDVDFVLYPGYWLRSSIPAGDITIENIQSVFANPTVLQYVTYSAQELVDAMQKSLSVMPGEGTAFTHVSGITVTYTMADTATVSTVKVGDTLIYADGALQVGDDWTASGVFTLTGGEIDSWTGSTESWICSDKSEVQQLVIDYLQTHTAGTDYVIHENTIAPDGRITEDAA